MHSNISLSGVPVNLKRARRGVLLKSSRLNGPTTHP
jgi:hypothetical protein